MINNPRVFLWIALALVLLLNYEQWTRDYAPPGTTSSGSESPTGSVSQPRAPDLSESIPKAQQPQGQGSAARQAAVPAVAAETAAGSEAHSAEVVHARTDVLDLDISTRGGTIQRADLLKYPRVKGEATPVRLENGVDPQTLYLLESGLTGAQGDAVYPTHLALFGSVQSSYALDGAAELRVPFTWSQNGVSVIKTYVLHRGEYRIDVEYRVQNQGATAWEAASYTQILRNDPPTSSSMFNPNVESYAFHGPAVYDGTKYRRLKITDADDSHFAETVKGGWIAALQHHFVSAVVPPRDVPYAFALSTQGTQYLLSARGPTTSVVPGATATFSHAVFIGPKLQRQLEATGAKLELVADYGKLTMLAKPLFWMLDKVHVVTSNWGVAIIVVTFLLKLVFYPLSEASGRSMAKMKALQPRIKNLQETYKDDREKLGRAMMELYQREKINPVAGCLPIVIQIPVFLAFYWVLLESVEMRQAPFAFWINDLSSRDPWFILPGIMAAAMFAQYKLNPAPPDPVQAKVFMFMPFAMSVMFAFFPAGLVLYWVTNTILSIAQQWNINRRIAGAASKS